MNESVSRVRDVLAELIRAALASDDAESLAHRQAAARAQADLAADPPDPASLRIDGAWTLAIQAAETPGAGGTQGRVNLTLPRQSLFALDELVSPDFDADGAVERVRKSASTG